MSQITADDQLNIDFLSVVLAEKHFETQLDIPNQVIKSSKYFISF